VLGHAGEGAKIVQPVGKFDDHHLQLGRRPAENFAMHQLLESLAVAGVMGDLGAALDDRLHIGTELLRITSQVTSSTSSTVSWSRAAARISGLRISNSSARIRATEQGCMM
jgi:hypothetical protein